MRFRVLLIGLCLSAEAAASVEPGDRVVMMGDSQAFMLKREMTRIAELDNVRLYTEPVPGSSVIQWATSLETNWGRIHALRPTVLIISLGSNDVCMGTRIIENEEPFVRRFMRRVRRVKAREVYWVGPPNIGGPGKLRQAAPASDPFVQMVTRLADGVVFLDSRTTGFPMMSDFLHPTVEGAIIWANWVWWQVTGKET